jgi:hypothetical protein
MVTHCGLYPRRWHLSCPLGREAQATEAVHDKLKAPKVNSFTEGEVTTRQVFTVGGDGKL